MCQYKYKYISHILTIIIIIINNIIYIIIRFNKNDVYIKNTNIILNIYI